MPRQQPIVRSTVFLFFSCVLHASLHAAEPEPLTLDALVAGKLNTLDLTYALNENSIHWPGENYEPFRIKTIATLDKDGVLSKAFCMPEHMGTHIDAPNHFERNQPGVDRVPSVQLFCHGVVIDVTAQASADPDYRLTLADLARWESDHGPIPQQAVVLMRSGWGRFWQQPARFKNQDVRGRLHFPGFSVEAVRWLLENRDIRGIGVDTMSIDFGLSSDFAVHHLINGAGRFGLENVAQLERLPLRDFYLIIAPIKIEDGTGGPTRIFAITR
jgi:kynurenine formamidase